MRKELFPLLENYAQTCTTLCELPLSHGEMSAMGNSVPTIIARIQRE